MITSIPDEYREKAARLVYGLECYGISFESITEDAREEDIMSIARALLEERKACAKVADSIASAPLEGPAHDVWDRARRATARDIAATIRNSTHPTHSAAAPLEAR